MPKFQELDDRLIGELSYQVDALGASPRAETLDDRLRYCISAVEHATEGIVIMTPGKPGGIHGWCLSTTGIAA